MTEFFQSTNNLNRFRAPALIFAAIALWVTLPFYLGADSSVSRADSFRPALSAVLTGSPITNVTPRGSAVYQSNTNTNTNTNTARSLSVSVSSVNLPSATVLQVALNGTSIGQITLNSNRSGSLNLSTNNGGTVPTVVAGDTLTVANGTTTVLSGAFVAPTTPSPSPTRTPNASPSPTRTPNGSPTPTVSPTASPTPNGSPTPQPTRTRYYAALTGAAIDGVIPRGTGSYEAYGTRTEFETYVNFVNLPDNTVLTVSVNGAAVGSITLDNHRGCLRLSSTRGDVVPVVAIGSTISVNNGTTVVLSGTFASAFPSPSPTPSGSPTPSPTPRPIRAFSAKLRGSNVVPAVTTNARGSGFVRLNNAETQITVNLRYFGLSGAAIATTINGPALPTANGAVVFTLINSGGTSGQIEQQTFDVTAEQVQQLRSGLLYFVVSTATNADGEIRGQLRPLGHRNDFDGDGASEISVLRQNGANSSTWYILNSLDNSLTARSLGKAGDINVQGDYDGDGVTDAAVFTPANGNWEISRSATGETVNYRFGQQGDVPMVGDYDGDGRNDITVFRPSAGAWYVWRSTDNAFYGIQFGASTDKPIAGDYDGDGINDFAVFRPSNGGWYVFQSSTKTMFGMNWGASTDRPVTGDFDGDGRSDVAVFRPSNGYWFIYRSGDGGMTAYPFGQNGDIPIACEYDSDNRTDIAVFRPSNGYWYILRSTDNGFSAYQFGYGTDTPLPVVYAP